MRLKCLVLLNIKGKRMFIAWYWIVLIVLVVVGYFLHLKRYSSVQDETHCLKRGTNT